MRSTLVLLCSLVLVACISLPPSLGTESDIPPGDAREALSGFDGLTNGAVDQETFNADLVVFDDVETLADGLGPLYNAQSCRECHQNPISGGISQVSELRAGIRDASGFRPPRVPIARGTVFVEGRTLINERATCPSGAYPNDEIQEHVPDDANVRTFRMSLNLLGDGFVEAMPDESLRALAARQCRDTNGRICGRAFDVPVLEALGVNGAGRFGWKSQQASLLSFAADAYLNEMGITSRLLPDEATKLCDAVPDPEDRPESAAIGQRAERRAKAGLARSRSTAEFADIDRFARFMRSTKVPPRDTILAQTAAAKRGSTVFDNTGCATCHVRNLVTAPTGTLLNGGTYSVPAALGNRLFHPFSDFLMHDVDTGDGIEIAVIEHHGIRHAAMQRQMSPTIDRLRTPPLWGLRIRSRFMHDGGSLTLLDAIQRHGGEASDARRRFSALSTDDREALSTFLRSL